MRQSIYIKDKDLERIKSIRERLEFITGKKKSKCELYRFLIFISEFLFSEEYSNQQIKSLLEQFDEQEDPIESIVDRLFIVE